MTDSHFFQAEVWLAAGSLFLQMTMIMLSCCVLVVLFRQRSAALAHRIWSLGFLGAILLPALLWIGSSPFPIEVGTDSIENVAQVSEIEVGASSSAQVRESKLNLDLSDFEIRSDDNSVSIDEANSSQPTGVQSLASRFDSSSSAESFVWISRWLPQGIGDWLISVWVVVSSLLFVRLLAAIWCLRVAIVESTPAGGRIEKVSNQVSANLALNRKRFQIRVAKDERMPVAFWLKKWVVILPSSANDWDDQMLQSVLAHEIGHVRRRDTMADFVSQLALVGYWFHPLVWFALSDSKRLREQACDDLVVERAQLSAATYARNLLDVVSKCEQDHTTNRLASAIASPNNVEHRIRRILSDSISNVPSKLVTGLVLGIVAMVVAASPMIRLALAENLGIADVQPEFLMSASGTVVDADGKPYPNAEVTLRIIPAVFGSNISQHGCKEAMARVKTNSQGEFKILESPIPGPYRDATRSKADNHRFELIVKTPDFGLTHQPLLSLESRELKIKLKPLATVEGIVADDRGNPLKNALIEAVTIAPVDAPYDGFAQSTHYSNFIFSSEAPQTRSKSDGRFRFDGLPDNSRIVCWVSHATCPRESFFALTGKNAKLKEFENPHGSKKIKFLASPVRVEMKRGFQAVASVVDQNGQPVAATLEVGGNPAPYMIENDDPRWKYCVAAKKAGKYRLWTRPIDSNLVVGSSFELDEFSLESPEMIKVKVPQTRKIKGRVVNDLGKPISGIQVSWNSADNAKEIYISSSANTDANGNFEMEVTPGKGKFYFGMGADRIAREFLLPNWGSLRGADDHDSQWPVDVPVEGDFTASEIVISRGLVVSGVVRGSDGKPVANAKVKAITRDRLSPSTGFATSDTEGKYTILGLNPRAAYEIGIAGPLESVTESTERFDKHPLTESKLLTLDLKTKPTIALFGRVMLEGKPYANLPIFLDYTTHYITEVCSTTTDSEGRYRLNGVFPGDEYRVRIKPPIPLRAPGWKHQGPIVQSVPHDVDKEMELEDMNLVRLNQTISGKVVDFDGKPVKGATISASMLDGRRLSRFNDYPVPWAESDAEGKFTISHLPEEKVKLHIYMPPTGDDRRIRNSTNFRPKLNQKDIEVEIDPSWN